MLKTHVFPKISFETIFNHFSITLGPLWRQDTHLQPLLKSPNNHFTWFKINLRDKKSLYDIWNHFFGHRNHLKTASQCRRWANHSHKSLLKHFLNTFKSLFGHKKHFRTYTQNTLGAEKSLFHPKKHSSTSDSPPPAPRFMARGGDRTSKSTKYCFFVGKSVFKTRNPIFKH